MDINAKSEGSTLYVTLKGKLGAFFGVKEFSDAVAKEFTEEKRFVIIDTSDMEYISSSGIRVLLETHKKALNREGTLALVGLQPYCSEILKLVGIANDLPIFITIDEAEQYCRELKSAP